MSSSVWYLSIPSFVVSTINDSNINSNSNNSGNNKNNTNDNNNNNNNTINHRKIIWKSNETISNNYPSINILSSIIDSNVDINILNDLTIQICKYSPIETIPGILSCFICNYWRNDKG